jgi:large subunit ribosomal protein L23
MSKLHRVLLAPVVTEKMVTSNARENSVGFWVLPSANKADIGAAVESFFKVTVERVRTVTVRPKQVRFGRSSGFQKAKKKAYVTLADGHTISFIEA